MPLRLTSLGKASISKMISVKWAKWLSLVMFLGNVSGQTYSASFTMYGSADAGGTTCNRASTACGFYALPGYAAAVSQNLFGAAAGQGPGPACFSCYYASVSTTEDGTPLSNQGNSILLVINDLCPADANNPRCANPNAYGVDVNVDLCEDSGAAAALFQNDGVGLAYGWITQTDCQTWLNSGAVVHM